MTQQKPQEELLSSLIRIAENLNQTLDELLEVMSDQKAALVSSDVEQVEKLTEAHSLLSVTYHRLEENFVKIMREILEGETDEEVRMTGLANVFPEAAIIINTWRKTLVEKTSLLQKKQQHIIDLLEFVMSRNSSMMKTIYSLHNEKNTHYSVTGNKESLVSGVTVNQKA